MLVCLWGNWLFMNVLNRYGNWVAAPPAGQIGKAAKKRRWHLKVLVIAPHSKTQIRHARLVLSDTDNSGEAIGLRPKCRRSWRFQVGIPKIEPGLDQLIPHNFIYCSSDTFTELNDQIGSAHVLHGVLHGVLRAHVKSSPSSFWHLFSETPCSWRCFWSVELFSPASPLLRSFAMKSGLVARLQSEKCDIAWTAFWWRSNRVIFPSPGRFFSEVPGCFAE